MRFLILIFAVIWTSAHCGTVSRVVRDSDCLSKCLGSSNKNVGRFRREAANQICRSSIILDYYKLGNDCIEKCQAAEEATAALMATVKGIVYSCEMNMSPNYVCLGKLMPLDLTLQIDDVCEFYAYFVKDHGHAFAKCNHTVEESVEIVDKLGQTWSSAENAPFKSLINCTSENDVSYTMNMYFSRALTKEEKCLRFTAGDRELLFQHVPPTCEKFVARQRMVEAFTQCYPEKNKTLQYTEEIAAAYHAHCYSPQKQTQFEKQLACLKDELTVQTLRSAGVTHACAAYAAANQAKETCRVQDNEALEQIVEFYTEKLMEKLKIENKEKNVRCSHV